MLFKFENAGTHLEVADCGIDAGIKVEIVDECIKPDYIIAIMLPPAVANELANFINRSFCHLSPSTQDMQEDFGTVLKQRRTEKGLSLEKAAIGLKKSVKTGAELVSRFERGLSMPIPQQVILIAENIDEEPKELLEAAKKTQIRRSEREIEAKYDRRPEAVSR